MLTDQLETTDDPAARAAVLTDLARTASEGFADATEAQRCLDEALSLVPDHLPAVLAIADIYYKEGQWEQAEKRLTEAVRRLRNQPQQAAKLFQRLAEVHEKLGKLDEAYRQLVEADRMGPGQLLTKLSLGENRFRAGRWREASLHLASLGRSPGRRALPGGGGRRPGSRRAGGDQAAPPGARHRALRVGARPSRGPRPHPARAGRPRPRAGREAEGHDLPAAHRRGVHRRATRAQVFEQLGDQHLELDDVSGGAGRLRRGAARAPRPRRRADPAAREDAERAARGRRRRWRGPHVGAADRAGQGPHGARRATPRRGR